MTLFYDNPFHNNIQSLLIKIYVIYIIQIEGKKFKIFYYTKIKLANIYINLKSYNLKKKN